MVAHLALYTFGTPVFVPPIACTGSSICRADSECSSVPSRSHGGFMLSCTHAVSSFDSLLLLFFFVMSDQKLSGSCCLCCSCCGAITSTEPLAAIVLTAACE
eukprot:scaffold95389_cov63-Phaeocystis_antarctica.AAC.1